MHIDTTAQALFRVAINSTSDKRARACLQCSIRNIQARLRRDTFKRSLAIPLLANNARDFARATGINATQQDLTDCANMLCDWILAIQLAE